MLEIFYKFCIFQDKKLVYWQSGDVWERMSLETEYVQERASEELNYAGTGGRKRGAWIQDMVKSWSLYPWFPTEEE